MFLINPEVTKALCCANRLNCYRGNKSRTNQRFVIAGSPRILNKQIQGEFRANSIHVYSRKVYWGCRPLCTTIHIRHILIPIVA